MPDELQALASWWSDLLLALQERAATMDWSALGRSVFRESPFLLFIILAVVLSLLRRRRQARLRSARLDLSALTRQPRALGYTAGLVFALGFAGWAAMAALASAAIAPGVVSPDGYRKTIQHLEGGIIRSIHVREGEKVGAGQVLVTLEATDARGKLEELRERYVHYVTLEARLLAEQTGAEEIILPEEVDWRAGEVARRALDGQQELLRSRRATREGRELILRQRVKQIEEEIAGLHEVVEAQDAQLALIDREIAGARELYDKGLERLPRLLGLERAQADIQAGRASNRAQIARNEQEIGEAEMQLLTMRQQDQELVDEELTKVRTALAEIRSQLPSREDVLTRTAIAAPIAGTVMNLRITTESGVIGAGQPILDIVPLSANLIVDARVKPIDIDTVEPGMRARVLLPAYRQRNLPQIHGSLRSISADRLTDDNTGESYFLAKVEVDSAELASLEEIRLRPGMPAEVMILTGEHTLLDYILGPLTESLAKSFREN